MLPDSAVERLADADLKLEWSDQHIRNLADAISAVAPYELRKDSHTPPGLSRVVSPPISPHLVLIACDAAHNIRIALDYLVCALAELNGKTASGVSFPVAADVDEFMKPQCQDKIRKLSTAAKGFINGLKPYKGGNDLLWALHEVDRMDKHRNLINIVEAPWTFVHFPESHEAPVTGSVVDTEHRFELRLNPSFAEISAFERKPALELLQEMSACVFRILADARATFFPGTMRAAALAGVP